MTASPLQQTVAVTLSQLSRYYRAICNNYRSFKEATGKLIHHMVKRGHPVQQLQRAFKIHLASRSLNLPTNNQGTRQSTAAIVNWFNRMILWVVHHLDVPPFTISSSAPAARTTVIPSFVNTDSGNGNSRLTNNIVHAESGNGNTTTNTNVGSSSSSNNNDSSENNNTTAAAAEINNNITAANLFISSLSNRTRSKTKAYNYLASL